jgi:Tetratricopeptide repeat
VSEITLLLRIRRNGSAPRGGRLARLAGTARARRLLRRATSQLGQDDIAGAVVLAEQGVAGLVAHLNQPGGCRSAELVTALNTLADAHLGLFDLTSAEVALDQAFDLLPTDASQPDPVLGCDVLVRRGTIRRLQNRHDQAEQDLTGALAVAPDMMRRAGALNALGILAKDTGQYAAAGRLYREALDIIESHAGDAAVECAGPLHNLAGLEHAQHRHHHGEPYIRRALALRAAQPVPNPAAVASDRGVLAALLTGQGRKQEAESLFLELLAEWTRLRGPDHYEVGFCHRHLAALRRSEGDNAAAAAHYTAALDITRRVLGDHHPEVQDLRADLTRLGQQPRNLPNFEPH